MKRVYTLVTETYETSVKGFMVDVVIRTSDGIVEFWLYHKDYAIKQMMFGIHEEVDPASVIDSSLMDYIKAYRKQYMEGANA